MNKLTLRKNIQCAGFKDINNETKQMLLDKIKTDFINYTTIYHQYKNPNITNKSKIFDGYKNKIDELSNRVKKYQEELNKIKCDKKNNSKTEETDSSPENSNTESDSTYSDISEPSIEENELLMEEKIKKKDDDNEFFLG